MPYICASGHFVDTILFPLCCEWNFNVHPIWNVYDSFLSFAAETWAENFRVISTGHCSRYKSPEM